MRLLFLPFAIFGRIISARLGKSVFNSIWMRIDAATPPPSPTSGQAGTVKVAFAHALEASVMAGVAAAVEHTNARFFHHLIGVWPSKPTRYETADD
jgi:hypothetical protein